ncbi:MAG: hypothetical protein QGH20_01635, partial [Candidatus Latescibacteria bacterium]|nr:hypothetical protein [Candidatus Latescibacterota bacterium]
MRGKAMRGKAMRTRTPVMVPLMIGIAALIHTSSAQTPDLSHTTHGFHIRPDGHGPIAIMGDHTHHQGSVMTSYRVMHMSMKGLLDGTDEVTTDAVLDAGYMTAPTDMTMTMHMVGAMYAVTDRFTVMAMVPYMDIWMDHTMRMTMGGMKPGATDADKQMPMPTEVTFVGEPSGVGDAKLTALYNIRPMTLQNPHRFLGLLGLSFPTGSVTEMGTPPMSPDTAITRPYPMQIGSGSVDLRLGVTYLGMSGPWGFGAQATGVIRLNENSEKYKLGNRLGLTAWSARKFANWISTSVRVYFQQWGNLSGEDHSIKAKFVKDMDMGGDGHDHMHKPAINTPLYKVPTADPNLQGGKRADALLGINLRMPRGILEGNWLGVEFGLPIYQDLNGPQMKTEWMLTVGW